VSFRARARMRPVLYPAAILVAFVLNLLVATDVSPYAAGRPLIAAVAIGLLAPWLAGFATGHRDRAGLLGAIVVLMVLSTGTPAVLVLCIIAVALVGLQPRLARRPLATTASVRDLWPVATRVLSIGAVILLVAVGIKAIQLGRVETFATDLVAEAPFRSHQITVGATPRGAPNMVFILLDGYPRSDKLLSEFGIDNSAFINGLRARHFVVADRSRSNETSTTSTLAQMFNFESASQIASSLNGAAPPSRVTINDGAFFGDLHRLGYQTVAVSPGFEDVALRRADTFIDTGQLNEFESVTVQVAGLSSLADAVNPNLAADQDRARTLDAFRVAEAQAQGLGADRKFVFVHVSPRIYRRCSTPPVDRST